MFAAAADADDALKAEEVRRRGKATIADDDNIIFLDLIFFLDCDDSNDLLDVAGYVVLSRTMVKSHRWKGNFMKSAHFEFV